jgi:hypothetical protein
LLDCSLLLGLLDMDLYSTMDRSILKDTCLSQDKEVFRLDTQHQLRLMCQRYGRGVQVHHMQGDDHWSRGHDSPGTSHRASKTHHPRDLAELLYPDVKAACGPGSHNRS